MHTTVKIENLTESPHNPRKTFDNLDGLAESIELHGILQPLVVRDLDTLPGQPTFEIVCGHRRFRAAKLSGLGEVPVEVRDLTDEQVREVQLVENLQREDVPPLEEAVAFKQLLDAGIEVADVAAKVGKSAGYVHKRVQLTALGKAAREALAKDQITLAVAALVARLPDEAGQEDMLKEMSELLGAVDEVQVTAAEAARMVESRLMVLSKAPFSRKDAALVEAAGSCDSCPKRTGAALTLIDDVGGKGDRCTDGTCYKLKVRANADRVLERAQAAGQKVISAEKSAPIFKHGFDDRPPISSTWVALDDSYAPSFGTSNRKQVRKILGEKNKDKVRVAIAPSGVAIELVRKAELDEILEGKKSKAQKGKKSKAQKPDRKVVSFEEQRRRREKQRAVRRAVVDKVLGKFPADPWPEVRTHQQMRVLAARALRGMEREDLAELGLKAKGWQLSPKAEKAFVGSLTVEECHEVIERALLSGAAGRTYDNQYGKTFQEWCAASGVDLKKLDKEAKKQAAQEARAAAAGAKKQAAKKATKKKAKAPKRKKAARK